LERECEATKIETALKPDFNLLDAFKIFDFMGTGNVSIQDVINALRDNLSFSEFTHDDVFLLFRRYDTNGDGKLNFTEFSNMMMPVSKEYSALLTDRPDFYMARNMPISQFFNSDTRYQLRALWSQMFATERACEVLRVSLRNRPYFNIKHAFSYIDGNIDGFLALEDLREYLANNGFFSTERELIGLM
jgi:Ca2+-binding EF-hand superfamily protein